MGKTIEKVEVSPEELFNEVLLELNERGKIRFHVNLRKWHKAFYDAKSKYAKLMGGFETLVRAWPYVHAVTECFHEFRHAHHLSLIAPDGDYLINDPEHMRGSWKPNPEVQEIARYICDRI